MIWKVCTQKGEALPSRVNIVKGEKHSIHIYSLPLKCFWCSYSRLGTKLAHISSIMLRERGGRDSFTCCQSSHAMVASKTFAPDNHIVDTRHIDHSKKHTTSIFPALLVQTLVDVEREACDILQMLRGMFNTTRKNNISLSYSYAVCSYRHYI